MNSVGQLLKDHRQAGSVQELVGVECMVEERTFLTRSGELQTVLEARGRDSECLDPAELEATVRRWEGVTRTVGENFPINQYQLKTPHPALRRQTHADPVVEHGRSAIPKSTIAPSHCREHRPLRRSHWLRDLGMDVIAVQTP